MTDHYQLHLEQANRRLHDENRYLEMERDKLRDDNDELELRITEALLECAHQRGLLAEYDDEYGDCFGDGVEHAVRLIEKALKGGSDG